jgi:hypothetical protein
MGWNPTVRDVGEFANEDRRWVATLMGYDQNLSVTLDASAFDADHITQKGAIPSGVVLAKITASGKYGPWATAGAGGLATPMGFLFTSVNVLQGLIGVEDVETAADPVATLYIGPGTIDISYLPYFEGDAVGQGEWDDDLIPLFPRIVFKGVRTP